MSTSPLFEKVAECLYRNPSSRTYYALVKVKGKQHKRSLKTTDLAEAKRKLRDYRAEVEVTTPGAGKVTVRQVCEKYLQTIQDQAESTRVNKEIMLKKAQQHWGDTPVRNLKKSDVLEWLASLKLGTSWQNQHLRALRAALRLAVDDGVIYRSPLEGVKEKKVARPIRATPTFQEFQAIVDSIRSQRLSDTAHESADYVEFMGLAGLGLAEASALTWGDVNWKRGQMTTFRHKTKQGCAVPIYPQVLPLLQKRLKLAVASNGGNSPAPATKVFSVQDAKKAIEGACSRLGIMRYSSRSFRRLFITMAIERGVDVKVIAEWQGHRDGGKLILDTYSHVRPAHSDQMAKLMTMEKPSNVVEFAQGGSAA
jgi:integrase